MNEDEMRPVIIIGAPRSGTKMLRGIFASHPDVAVFPSEIDYIWRYGNEKHPNDQLTPELARPEVVSRIRKQFSVLSNRHNGARVVEKSVANSLRVSFVSSVFPDAYYVHLIRDGRATVESVRRSWESGISLNYYLQKFVGVNWKDAFYLAPDYIQYHLRRKGLFGSEKGVKGPHFDGIRELLKQKAFLEVCGIQWSECVKAARKDLSVISSDQVIEIRYEDLVANPVEIMQTVLGHVGLGDAEECINHVKTNVRDSDTDKWKKNLSAAEISALLPLVSSELKSLGYTA